MVLFGTLINEDAQVVIDSVQVTLSGLVGGQNGYSAADIATAVADVGFVIASYTPVGRATETASLLWDAVSVS